MKITSKFAPSVIRAARMLECASAITHLPVDSPMMLKALDTGVRMLKGYQRCEQQVRFVTGASFHDEVSACVADMQAHRAKLGAERKARRLAREAERVKALELIAA